MLEKSLEMTTAATQPYFLNKHHHPGQQLVLTDNSTVMQKLDKPNCSACLSRFSVLRNQVMQCMTIEYQRIFTGRGVPAFDSLPHIIYQSLCLNERELEGTVNGKCLYCDVHVELLKKKALEVVQTQFNPFLRNMNSFNSDIEHQLNDRKMASRGETTDSVNGQRIPGANSTGENGRENSRHGAAGSGKSHHSSSADSSKAPSSPTPAQFFTEVAKSIKNQNKRKHVPSSAIPIANNNNNNNININNKNNNTNNMRTAKSMRRNSDNDLFPTNFSYILEHNPPSNPPGLFKYMGRRVDGKVTVMLRVQQPCDMEQSDSFLEVDQRKKQVSVLQRNSADQNGQPVPPQQPKLFAFDQIFEPEFSQNRVSSGSLLDVLHAVINGGDGALVMYGGPSTGKTHTMVGHDDSNLTVGILPCAISWLYNLINDCKERTGARMSVRVSAVEVVGKNETLKDLLAEQTSETDSIDSSGASPGIYLREDTAGGSIQIDNVSEPQSSDAKKAGFYLDAALAARTTEKNNHGQTQNSHMIFTFHIYQYRVQKNIRRGPPGSAPFSGGRSRLHLIDLSYVNQDFAGTSSTAGGASASQTAPSHNGLGQIIPSMLNGHKKMSLFRDSKISRLLKDSIGNPTCRATVLAHVSTEEKQYKKTLQTLNVTSRIVRTRRKRNKNCSSSSDNTSCDESKKRYRLVNPMLKNNFLEDSSTQQSEYVSSSAGEGEDSCDTVIYRGANGHLSDRDLTDNERPPSPDTMKIMKMKLASSSEDETTEPVLDNHIHNTLKENSSSQHTANLHAKLSSMEEGHNNGGTQHINEKKTFAPKTEHLAGNKVSERAVNIVAPLGLEKDLPNVHDLIQAPSDVDKTACNVDRPLINASLDPKDVLPCTEISKESIIQQFLNSSIVVKSPPDDPLSELYPVAAPVRQDADYDNVSEKSLRKHEKRIEKLFSSLSEDENFDEIQNRKNTHKNSDGYTSDNCYTRDGVYARKSSKLDGYISAPEFSHRVKPKPVQIVRGTVRKQQSLDDSVVTSFCGVRDNDNKWKDGSCLEHVESITENGAPKHAELARVKKESFDKVQLSVSKFSSIRECVDGPSGSPNASSCVENSLPSDRRILPSEQKQDDPPRTNSKEKLQNLNHIITVSPIPNFAVAKKPSLTQFSQTQPVKPELKHLKSIDSCGSPSLDCTTAENPRSPTFPRSYSREDTISLISSHDSDAYESDAYSSYGTSPSLSGSQRRPQRLRYRWSTVYEEVEDKKDGKADKNTSLGKDHGKRRETVVDSEAKPSRILTSPKSPSKHHHHQQHSNSSSRPSLVSRFTKSPKTEKKSSSSGVDSDTPKGNKKYSSSKCDSVQSPKSKGRLGGILSPRSERKHKNIHSPDKRMSGCSDASSGLDSGIQSQTSSLRSGEDIKVDDTIIVREKELHSSKYRLWPFGRSKSRKSRSLSGYMSDSHVTDSTRSRRSRFFGSRSSKGSLNAEGYCSGYETSVTEGGMTSCAEDYTDNESVSGGSTKKKRRFLGFRRRSTNDLSQSRTRVKKPAWLDSRHCQSDDEGMQITKVYHLDEPREVNKRHAKSDNIMSPRSTKRIDGLRKQHDHLKSELRLALDKFPTVDPNAQLAKLHLTAPNPIAAASPDPRLASYQPIKTHDHQQYAANLERENAAMGRKLKVLRNHIQVVTCFDGSRKVTQI